MCRSLGESCSRAGRQSKPWSSEAISTMASWDIAYQVGLLLQRNSSPTICFCLVITHPYCTLMKDRWSFSVLPKPSIIAVVHDYFFKQKTFNMPSVFSRCATHVSVSQNHLELVLAITSAVILLALSCMVKELSLIMRKCRREHKYSSD